MAKHTAKIMNTVTLDQWNSASTEQRQTWLDNGVQMTLEDAARLARMISDEYEAYRKQFHEKEALADG